MKNFITKNSPKNWERILNCYYITAVVSDSNIMSSDIYKNINQILRKHSDYALAMDTFATYNIEDNELNLIFIKNFSITRNFFKIAIGFYNHVRTSELENFELIKNNLKNLSQNQNFKIYDNEIFGYFHSHNCLKINNPFNPNKIKFSGYIWQKIYKPLQMDLNKQNHENIG